MIKILGSNVSTVKSINISIELLKSLGFSDPFICREISGILLVRFSEYPISILKIKKTKKIPMYKKSFFDLIAIIIHFL